MAKFNSGKFAIACAISVMALAAAAPKAQANEIYFDLTFTTVGAQNGSGISGNFLLGVDSNTDPGASGSNSPLNGVGFSNGYDILQAYGEVTYSLASSPGSTSTVWSSTTDEGNGPGLFVPTSFPGTNHVDNLLFSNGAIGVTGTSYTFDAAGLGLLMSSLPNLSFGLNSADDPNDFQLTGWNGTGSARVTLPLTNVTVGNISGSRTATNFESVADETFNLVPAPTPLAVLGSGLAFLGLLLRRRRNAA